MGKKEDQMVNQKPKIVVSHKTKSALNKLKINRETYDDVIQRLLKEGKNAPARS